MTRATDITTLQTQIAQLTGRTPVSRDPAYLERRLADLRRRVDDGDEVRRLSSSRTVPMSISLSPEAVASLDRMVQHEKMSSASALVRLALAEYACNHGMRDERVHFAITTD